MRTDWRKDGHAYPLIWKQILQVLLLLHSVRHDRFVLLSQVTAIIGSDGTVVTEMILQDMDALE